MPRAVWLLVFACLLAFANAQAADDACSKALQYQNYAVQTLKDCGSPSPQNARLCQLIREFEDSPVTSTEEKEGHPILPQTDLVTTFPFEPAPNVMPWESYLTQAVLGQVADIGQVAYIASIIIAEWEPLLNETFTVDQYTGAFGRAFWSAADNLYDQAAAYDNPYDPGTKRDLYLEAANFYFGGAWPAITQEESQDALTKMRSALRNAFDTWEGTTVEYFNVSYTVNGTDTATLPGIFVTPDASKKLPLVIVGTGLDWPKEAFFLGQGPPFLNRNYAVIFYDGPGQGEALFDPPYLTFTNDWAGVVAPFIDYAEKELTQYVDTSRIANAGFSLGGYLAGRACAGLSDRIVACYLTPGNLDLISAFNVTAQYELPIYGGIASAAVQEPSLLPAGYAEAFANSSGIVDALLFECSPGSGAPQAFAAPLESREIVDPDLIYFASTFGGALSSDNDGLFQGLWYAYRHILEFTNPDIANISCPVFSTKGTQDNVLGGFEEAFFAALSPETQAKSQLVVFNASSGGALHDQLGAPIATNAALFAFLDPIMKAGMAPAPVSANLNPSASAGK